MQGSNGLALFVSSPLALHALCRICAQGMPCSCLEPAARYVLAWNEYALPALERRLPPCSLFLARLVILVIAIAAAIIGHSAPQEQQFAQVDGLIKAGNGGGRRMMKMQKPACGSLASLAGVLTLLFDTSAVFVELLSPDTIWDVSPGRRRNLRTLQKRVLSFGMVLCAARRFSHRVSRRAREHPGPPHAPSAVLTRSPLLCVDTRQNP